MSSFSEKIYSGAADYGKIRSGFNLFIGLIVCIVFFILGIYILRRPKIYTQNTIGKVKSSNCIQIQEQKNFVWNCSMNIDYQVNNKNYNTDLIKRSQKRYNTDDAIDLYHEVNNPRNISADKDDNNFGWLFIGISVIVLIALIVNFILTLYSSTYASVVGVTTATGDLFSVLKR